MTPGCMGVPALCLSGSADGQAQMLHLLSYLCNEGDCDSSFTDVFSGLNEKMHSVSHINVK